MKWEQLLSEKRERESHSTDDDERTEFQRDYHRIVSSASFRRLQDKTQVFPLDNSDFIRTRLTHSLEVSSFARSLGQMVFRKLMKTRPDEINFDIADKCCSILECAGLLHDIGNPPFGHFGEDSIRSWFERNLDDIIVGGVPASVLLDERMKNDLTHFEGNAQALRVVSKLHYLVDEHGMNLTYALLHTLIKYPVDSCHIDKRSDDIKTHKMGYYLDEEELFDKIVKATGTNGARYPLTFLLEAADDIAYRTADIEDAVKKGYISYAVLVDDLRKGKYAEECGEHIEKLCEYYQKAPLNGICNPEQNSVQRWLVSMQTYMLNAAAQTFVDNYDAIMAGTFGSDLLKSSQASGIASALGDIALKRVFLSQHIYKSEIAAATMIDFFLDRFVPAAAHHDGDTQLSPVEERYWGIISENYRYICEKGCAEKSKGMQLYKRLLLVTDFVCGMTDGYAKRSYQELSAMERGY